MSYESQAWFRSRLAHISAVFDPSDKRAKGEGRKAMFRDGNEKDEMKTATNTMSDDEIDEDSNGIALDYPQCQHIQGKGVQGVLKTGQERWNGL